MAEQRTEVGQLREALERLRRLATIVAGSGAPGATRTASEMHDVADEIKALAAPVGGERPPGDSAYDPRAAMRAALRASTRVRDGRWIRGAPSHVLADFLAELHRNGWELYRERPPGDREALVRCYEALEAFAQELWGTTNPTLGPECVLREAYYRACPYAPGVMIRHLGERFTD